MWSADRSGNRFSGQLLGNPGQILVVYKPINGFNGPTACRNGFDNRGRPGNRITGGKNKRNRCLHGMAVNRKSTPPGEPGPFTLRDPIHINLLANGRNDGITLDYKF